MSIPNTQFQGQYNPLGCVITPDVNQVTQTVTPASVASTSTLTAVPGTKIDLSLTKNNATYVVEEVGGINGITYVVQASNDGTTWFNVPFSTIASGGTVALDVSTQAVAAGTESMTYGAGTSKGTPPWPGRYLQIAVEDTVGGSHGVAQVNGFAY